MLQCRAATVFHYLKPATPVTQNHANMHFFIWISLTAGNGPVMAHAVALSESDVLLSNCQNTRNDIIF